MAVVRAMRSVVALRGIAVVVALAVAAGALLAWFAGLVEQRVEDNRRLARTDVLRQMLRDAALDAPLNFVAAGPSDVLLCAPSLAILRGVGAGYGGEFRIAVALDGDGRTSGVRVLEHGETPGFADILAADSAWLARFGASPNDVHAVTGATVTSQAVIDAVRRVLARVESGETTLECFGAAGGKD